MRYLVGYVPDDSGIDALVLARLLNQPPQAANLAVCTVVPQTATGGDAAYGAAGYAEYVGEQVEATQRRVQEQLGGLDTTFSVRQAQSAAIGLLEVAEELDAALLILGSARAGLLGRYVVGSVAGALQHASPVPLAFAPEGFADSAGSRITRISCGYSESADTEDAVRAGVQLARAYQVPLRLITFVFPEYPAIRRLTRAAHENPAHGEAGEAAESLRKAAAAVPDDVQVITQVATGGNIAQAVAQPGWDPAELLVLGSARLGPVSRVFLGSTSLKLLRTCPVPVVAVPRGATVRLAGSESTTGGSES